MQLCIPPVYCCVTNHLKCKVLKSQSFFFYLTSLQFGQSSRGKSLCTLWCQLGQPEWELEGPLTRWLTHMPGKLVLVAYQALGGLSCGYLSFLQKGVWVPKVNMPKQEK